MAAHGLVGRRLGLEAGLATAMSILLAGQALGLVWQPTVQVSARGRAVASTGVAVSGGTIHLGYEEAWGGVRHAVYRRSTDGGATLGSRFTLSGTKAEWASAVDVAASGSNVDTVWVEQELDEAGQPAGPRTLRYRRSTNAGVAWGPTATLGSDVGYPRVERASAVVLVTWTNVSTGQMWLRRSTDGGATFRAAVAIGTTTNLIDDGFLEGFPSVAFGSGIAYLIVMPNWKTVKVHRSTNGGASWTTATALAANASGWSPEIAATGTKAFVSYAIWNGNNVYPAVRATVDKGVLWTTATPLAAVAAPDDFQPVIGYGAGTWYAAFESCTTACATSRILFRSSTNGTTWTTAELVSTGRRTYNTPAGVVHAGAPVVVWYDLGGDPIETDVLLRRRG